MAAPFSGRHEARLIIFYKIIKRFSISDLTEAYNGTRRKHNKKFSQIGHSTNQYGQSFFPKTLLVHGTGLLSLKPRAEY